MQPTTVNCPECGNNFSTNDPEIGELLVCTDCGLNLLVKELVNNEAIVELTETDAEDWGQ